MRQILECVYPLHEEICPLIEEFVQAFCNMKNRDPNTKTNYDLLKLDNNLLKGLFDSHTCSSSSSSSSATSSVNKISFSNGVVCSVKNSRLSQYLVCFYMLLCEKYGVFPCYNSNLVVFDDDQLLQQWNMIPLKKLIITANSDQQGYLGDSSISKFNAITVDLRPQYFSNLIPHYSFVLEKKPTEPAWSNVGDAQAEIAKIYAKLMCSHPRLLESDESCDHFVEFLKHYPLYCSSILQQNSTVDITKSLSEIFKQCIVVYPEK